MVYQSLVIFAVSFFTLALSVFVLVAIWLGAKERERRIDQRLTYYVVEEHEETMTEDEWKLAESNGAIHDH